MDFQGTERRLRTRYRVRVPFVLKGAAEESHGITRNISLLGISAYADSPISQVQPVQCVLNVPEIKHPLLVQGTVIRCEALPEAHPDGPYEVGVFFKEFPGTTETELTQFLNRIAQEEYSAIQAGYKVLKQRIAARKRRKRTEELQKKKRKAERLRKRRLRLAKERRRAAQRERKRALRKAKTSSSKRSTTAQRRKRSS